MKISASIYSQKSKSLRETILLLDEHGIDFFHIDCNDDPSVFEDIMAIRQWSTKPIDLHIISSTPEKYYPLIESTPVEFVTFQYENLQGPIQLPNSIKAKKGLAFTSGTSIDAFEAQKSQFDFVLIMATTPGQSGGQFNKSNFAKVRAFQKKYPSKKIHVDGGVNAEISFILRNMGVYTSVSGSYLFKSDYLGAAMLNLKGQQFESQFTVGDIMIPYGECPVLPPDDRNLVNVLNSLEQYQLGFVMLATEDGKLEGIITNADIRRGLLSVIDNLNNIDVNNIVNRSPISADVANSVEQMLRTIKTQRIPINYMPVIDQENNIQGAITFFNLIKGEL